MAMDMLHQAALPLIEKGLTTKLAFVNIMQELQRFDSTAYITQPPVPLVLLNAATPKAIETARGDEQTDRYGSMAKSLPSRYRPRTRKRRMITPMLSALKGRG
jgi:hypothetical protein